MQDFDSDAAVIDSNPMQSLWIGDLGALADTAYAAELGQGLARLRFSPDLERVYLALHLARAKLRARLWQSSVTVICLLFSVSRVGQLGWWHPVSLLHVGLITPLAILAAWATWSSRYKHLYLPIARIAVPLTAAVAGIFAAQDATAGRFPEDLAVLSVQMMSIFLLSGLLFRAALLSGATLFLAFVAAGLYFQLALGPLLEFGLFLGMVGVIAAGSCWGMEQTSRRSFLMEGMTAELAVRDALTGLWNRRAFDRHLQRAWAQAMREHRSIAIVMFDVDHFKAVNDNRGHPEGDSLLRRVAACTRDLARRPLDMAARYGGDEFVLLLYDLPHEHATSVAERLRQAVTELRIEYNLTQGAAPVTVTIGIAVAIPAPGRSADEALHIADRALYRAKQAGRNCVHVIAQ